MRRTMFRPRPSQHTINPSIRDHPTSQVFSNVEFRHFLVLLLIPVPGSMSSHRLGHLLFDAATHTDCAVSRSTIRGPIPVTTSCTMSTMPWLLLFPVPVCIPMVVLVPKSFIRRVR